MAKYTPMIEQYLAIKAEHTDAFLFFRLGDFYEMFFEDAILAAQVLEITLTSRDGGQEKIPMCGVPFHSAHTYMDRLIANGYKVAICEQVENPSQAKGVVRREVVRVITPGTVIEQSMLKEQENNFLLALYEGEGSYSLAAVDFSTGECHVAEMDDVASVLDEVATYQPKEIIFEMDSAVSSRLFDACQQRFPALLTSMDEVEPNEERLERQFPTFTSQCKTDALRKVIGLLYSYLARTQKGSMQHMSRLHVYDPQQYMILDESARRNLELTSSLAEGKKQGSLLGLLDQTVTAMGSRLLKKWLDKPLMQLDRIEARQEMVQGFLDDLMCMEEIGDALRSVYDVERLAARIAYGSAHARDLAALRRTLQMIPMLKQQLQRLPSIHFQRLAKEMDECKDIRELLEVAIHDDPPLSIKEGGMIRQGYDSELDELQQIQRQGKGWIAELQAKERKETGIRSLKIGYNRVFGYHIEVTKSNLKNLPEGRYERKQTLANSERFITMELKKKEQMILNASERSIDLEYDLFIQVREQLSGQVSRLQRLSEGIARLDVLLSFSRVSLRHQFVRPKLHHADRLWIKEGRHPVVELGMKQGKFVANDVELDQKERQILLITGPNMAGKSTYMRQVALMVILGQIGCFVPAAAAEIPIVDRIFTRIGAADDLAGGRSTFMVEMTETCQALREATPHSLILFDEVGRGTSTYDGMALAYAIVEYIHQYVGAKMLFSTHYHELTELESELNKLVNIHAGCTEKEGKVIFLHRMLPGKADRSYGIQVAELAGLPEQVIQKAQSRLQELEENGAEVTNGVSTPHAQLSLFAPSSEPNPLEQEVLEKIQKWDVFNHTPLDTMQFLHRLQQRLSKQGG